MKNRAFTWLLALAVLSSCGIYSLREQGDIGTAEDFSVAFFPNRATLVNPFLSQQFTDALREKFSRETRLKQVESGGDLQFSGAITNYMVTPAALQTGTSAPPEQAHHSSAGEVRKPHQNQQKLRKNLRELCRFPFHCATCHCGIAARAADNRKIGTADF